MAWLKFDDGFDDDPDLDYMTESAVSLHLCASTWSSRNGTDGFIPEARAKKLFGHSAESINVLLNNCAEGNKPWWLKVKGGYQIRSFLKFNPSAEQVKSKHSTKAQAGALGAKGKWGETKSEANAKTRSQRLAAAREKGTHTNEEWESLLDIVGRRCLICGSEEITKDHIVPIYQGGSDSIDNLQPLCRSCNGSKGPDTTDHRLKIPAFTSMTPGKTPGKTSSATPGPYPVSRIPVSQVPDNPSYQLPKASDSGQTSKPPDEPKPPRKPKHPSSAPPSLGEGIENKIRAVTAKVVPEPTAAERAATEERRKQLRAQYEAATGAGQ